MIEHILGAISPHHTLPHSPALLAWLNDVGNNLPPLAAGGAAGAGAAGSAGGPGGHGPDPSNAGGGNGNGNGGDPYWNAKTKDGIPYHHGGDPASGQPPLEPSPPSWWDRFDHALDHSEPDRTTSVGRVAGQEGASTEESAMRNPE